LGLLSISEEIVDELANVPSTLFNEPPAATVAEVNDLAMTGELV